MGKVCVKFQAYQVYRLNMMLQHSRWRNEYVLLELISLNISHDIGKDRLSLNDDDKKVREWFIQITGEYGCSHKVSDDLESVLIFVRLICVHRSMRWVTFLL